MPTSEQMKAIWRDPKIRRRYSLARKKQWKNPEYREYQIEVDGSLWHNDYRRKRNRDQYLRRRGWSVNHFVADRSCKEKILRFLEAA